MSSSSNSIHFFLFNTSLEFQIFSLGNYYLFLWFSHRKNWIFIIFIFYNTHQHIYFFTTTKYRFLYFLLTLFLLFNFVFFNLRMLNWILMATTKNVESVMRRKRRKEFKFKFGEKKWKKFKLRYSMNFFLISETKNLTGNARECEWNKTN